MRINDQEHEWREGITLGELLDCFKIVPEQVASAVNGNFIPRTQRESTVLQADDHVTTFQAIVGG